MYAERVASNAQRHDVHLKKQRLRSTAIRIRCAAHPTTSLQAPFYLLEQWGSRGMLGPLGSDPFCFKVLILDLQIVLRDAFLRLHIIRDWLSVFDLGHGFR